MAIRRISFGVALLCVLLLGGCRSKPAPTPDPSPIVAPAPPSPSGKLKMVVAGIGLYRLPAEILTAAGMEPAALESDLIALWFDGQPVPYWIDPDGSALFFYGNQAPGRFTKDVVYWLLWGTETGLVMSEEKLPPFTGEPLSPIVNTLHLEENLEYISRAAGEVEEPWFGERFSPGVSFDYPFTLPALADGEGRVQVRLWGATTDSQHDPDHRVKLILNGQILGDIDWDGETTTIGVLPIPSGLLQEGENQLAIESPGDTGNLIDLSHLDWIKIDYPVPAELCDGLLALPDVSGDIAIPGAVHLFDLADPQAPLHLSSAEGNLGQSRSVVAVASDGGLTLLHVAPFSGTEWADVSHQADYLILAPQELAAAVQPLIEYRTQQGLAVELIPLEEIVDEFGNGVLTPAAINAFLRHAMENWAPPQPRYLLLVGEATYDFRDYLGLMPSHVAPPMLVSVSYGGETISDTRLADVDGDLRPDLAVGRWPVADAGVLADLVKRTLAYEAAAQTSSNAIFVADGSESSFAGMSDRLLEAAGLSGKAQQLYGATGEETIQAWNQGAWLVNYVGHGSLNLWGRTELLSRDSVASLNSTGRPPIVTQFTCLTGFFAHPQYSSLAEEMLWSENGPVAVVAATSLTLASNQETFAALLMQALTDPEVRTIGDALLRAQQSPEMNYGGAQEIIDTFNLLGDPALLIARPG